MDFQGLVAAARGRGSDRIRFWLATGHQQDYKLDDWNIDVSGLPDVIIFVHKTKNDSAVIFMNQVSVIIFDL